MKTCQLRKVSWLHPGWRADCTCGFTSGEKKSFSDAMTTLENHWFAYPEGA